MKRKKREKKERGLLYYLILIFVFIMCPPLALIYNFVGFGYLIIYFAWVCMADELSGMTLSSSFNINLPILDWIFQDGSVITDITSKIYTNTFGHWMNNISLDAISFPKDFPKMWFTMLSMFFEGFKFNGIIAVLLILLPALVSAIKNYIKKKKTPSEIVEEPVKIELTPEQKKEQEEREIQRKKEKDISIRAKKAYEDYRADSLYTIQKGDLEKDYSEKLFFLDSVFDVHYVSTYIDITKNSFLDNMCNAILNSHHKNPYVLGDAYVNGQLIDFTKEYPYPAPYDKVKREKYYESPSYGQKNYDSKTRLALEPYRQIHYDIDNHNRKELNLKEETIISTLCTYDLPDLIIEKFGDKLKDIS